ncbi:MAG: redox-regulated ATPase YchF, partial [Anaerolineaceae bacterium]
MQLGIIGLPQSGKTTIFNALTRGTVPTGGQSGRMEVHTAVVDVPDERVDKLSAMFSPKKTIYAKVTYADIAGLDGSAGSGGLSGQLLNTLNTMNGFIHVVRCFEDEMVPHPAGSVDPLRDLMAMDAEFLLNDMIVVERKLERLTEEMKKGAGRDKALIQRETALFERLKAALEQETLLRDLDLTPEEIKSLAGFGLMTLKPALVALNLGEGQTPPQINYAHKHTHVVPLQGKLEMEIAQLPPDEMKMFMEEYNIQEPALNLLIRLSYDLLGVQPFFTYGPDEVRAWTVRRGANAQEAAGAIHSDLEKGFIRAEVMAYDDLMTLGSVAEMRAKGKFRLEGKQYIVQDG